MEIYLKKVMKSIMSHQIQVAPLKAKVRAQNQVQAAIKYFLRKSRDTESDLQTPQKSFRIFPDRMAGLLITLLKKKRNLIKMKIKVRNQKTNPLRIPSSRNKTLILKLQKTWKLLFFLKRLIIIQIWFIKI